MKEKEELVIKLLTEFTKELTDPNYWDGNEMASEHSTSAFYLKWAREIINTLDRKGSK